MKDMEELDRTIQQVVEIENEKQINGINTNLWRSVTVTVKRLEGRHTWGTHG